MSRTRPTCGSGQLQGYSNYKKTSKVTLITTCITGENFPSVELTCMDTLYSKTILGQRYLLKLSNDRNIFYNRQPTVLRTKEPWNFERNRWERTVDKEYAKFRKKVGGTGLMSNYLRSSQRSPLQQQTGQCWHRYVPPLQ